MLPRAKKNVSTRPGHTQHDPVHQHLVWALGSATTVLIANAVSLAYIFGLLDFKPHYCLLGERGGLSLPSREQTEEDRKISDAFWQKKVFDE